MGFIITPQSNEEDNSERRLNLKIAEPTNPVYDIGFFDNEIKDLIAKRAAELDEFLKEKINLHLKWYHKLFILFNKKLIRKYVKIILQKGESISQLEKRGVQIYNEIYWLD